MVIEESWSFQQPELLRPAIYELIYRGWLLDALIVVQPTTNMHEYRCGFNNHLLVHLCKQDAEAVLHISRYCLLKHRWLVANIVSHRWSLYPHYLLS